jgi:hypothetical protein
MDDMPGSLDSHSLPNAVMAVSAETNIARVSVDCSGFVAQWRYTGIA